MVPDQRPLPQVTAESLAQTSEDRLTPLIPGPLIQMGSPDTEPQPTMQASFARFPDPATNRIVQMPPDRLQPLSLIDVNTDYDAQANLLRSPGSAASGDVQFPSEPLQPLSLIDINTASDGQTGLSLKTQQQALHQVRQLQHDIAVGQLQQRETLRAVKQLEDKAEDLTTALNLVATHREVLHLGSGVDVMLPNTTNSTLQKISSTVREANDWLTVWKFSAISAGVWLLLITIIACFYARQKVDRPLPGPHHDVSEFDGGEWLFDLVQCLHQPGLCLCACCCGPIRWADTIRMAGFATFRFAFALFAILYAFGSAGIYIFEVILLVPDFLQAEDPSQVQHPKW